MAAARHHGAARVLAVDPVAAQPGLALEPLLPHSYRLADHAAAFAMARSGRCGKVIFDPRDPDRAAA